MLLRLFLHTPTVATMQFTSDDDDATTHKIQSERAQGSGRQASTARSESDLMCVVFLRRVVIVLLLLLRLLNVGGGRRAW